MTNPSEAMIEAIKRFETAVRVNENMQGSKDKLALISSQVSVDEARTAVAQQAATPAAPVQDDDAENIARLFHETYERLAPQFSYETRKASAKPWNEVPENNRKLMIAVAAEVRARLTPDRVTPLVEALREAAKHFTWAANDLTARRQPNHAAVFGRWAGQAEAALRDGGFDA